jgi:3-oxoadipate enol-lactonase
MACPRGHRVNPISPHSCTRWMSGAIKHAETVVFEDSSHFFLMEEPERFMDTMNGWLARHTPRA